MRRPEKRRRTSGDGGGSNVIEEEVARRPLVVRLRQVPGGGWVSARAAVPSLALGGALRRGGGGDGVKLLQQKERLVLVLDLDHTLLHSTDVRHLSPQETYLVDPCHSHTPPPPPLLFYLRFQGTVRYLTKLRPFVRTFLRESSAMYRLCICTMGERSYAQEMVRLLDPEGIYFSAGDVVSRSDFTEKGRKGLDVIHGCSERTAVILDDTASVWEKHRGNLVQMPPYHYFAHSRRKIGLTGQSLAELRRDESEAGGALAAALNLLRRIHGAFFFGQSTSGEPATRDVRDVLRSQLRKKPEAPALQHEEKITVQLEVR